MRVCLLTDESIDDFNPSQYLLTYEWDYVTVETAIQGLIQTIAQSGQYDIYLNMYEGLDEEENSGLKCIETLENLNLVFTGADSKFYDPTREEMQAVAEKNQINFARGFHADSQDDLLQANDLEYPLIVKHPNSYASTGLTKDSRVPIFEELQTEFQKTSLAYGSARVEEFVEGRELSCFVVENADAPAMPYVYSPAEVQFPDGESFLHEDAKWLDWGVFVVPLHDDVLARRIQDISQKFFVAMGGTGYARVDIRVRPNREIVILEINPNCGVLYSLEDRSHADLPISWDKDGHNGFLDRIFRSALARQKMRSFQNKHPA